MTSEDMLTELIQLKKNYYELGSRVSKLKTAGAMLNESCRHLFCAHLQEAESKLGEAWTSLENAQRQIIESGPGASKNNDRTWV